jgi:hypothetical protein
VEGSGGTWERGCQSRILLRASSMTHIPPPSPTLTAAVVTAQKILSFSDADSCSSSVSSSKGRGLIKYRRELCGINLFHPTTSFVHFPMLP